MLSYQTGQFYEVHHDYYFVERDEAMQHGPRILTVYLYLNNVEAGGGTSFPELNLTVMPKRGRALIWPSVLDSSPAEIDWRTEHEAHTVEKGVKYGANVWFHLKPFRLAYKNYTCCETSRKYIENGPDAWKAGDLGKMFQRIVEDPKYNTNILSSPSLDGQFTSEQSVKRNDKNPWIIIMDNFITAEEAQHIITWGAEEGYEHSRLYEDDKDDITSDNEEEDDDDHKEEGGISWRTSWHSWCGLECSNDRIVQSILNRIYDLTQLGQDYSEPMQMLKYEKQQYYKEHSDFLDLDPETKEQEGDRILTVYLYLNDVEAGGETSFLQLNLTVSPKAGRLVMWPSVLDAMPSDIDWRTEHESHPVENGVKFGANVWFRLKPYRQAYQQFVCDESDEQPSQVHSEL